MNIILTTQGGQIFDVKLKQDFTLADFKTALQKQLPDENLHGFIFVCCGKQLYIDNEARFNSQKHLIRNRANIFMLKRMHGGGCLGVDFVDLNNTAGLKRREWSATAPEWRIAIFGLCLEGKCNNKSCKAYQQQVIVKIGFGKFNVATDFTDTSNCPMCSMHVKPIMCAFVDCRWRWEGIKETESGIRPEKLSKDWQIADCAYHIFDENISGTVHWQHLVIEVEQR